MALFLKNATFIDYKTLKFKNCNIKIEKGIDKEIEFVSEIISNQEDEIIDCTGKYVTKSFACGHHHIYSALACGMPAPKKNPENFQEILKYIWWDIDKKLDKQMIEASAYATGIELIRNGSTFVIDHHASPNFIEGSLDVIANVFDKMGISHLLAYEVTDRDGFEKADEGLWENERYLQNNQGLIGVHAAFTMSQRSLENISRIADKSKTGIHIHIAEDVYDQYFVNDIYNTSVIEHLNNYNLLKSSKSIFAHAIHINAKEREMIKNSPIWLVVNSESNQNNKVGKFSSIGLHENIMLGTDGMHSDMIRSAQSNFFGSDRNENVGFDTIYNRFRNVHKYLQTNNFKGDGENNLVVLDYQPRTEFNENNFLGHFVFAMESRNIQYVISNGELVMKDRKLTKINETEILKFSQEQSVRLWNELKK